jgi:uncharacterized protein YtpQ (UPF0354 family)
MQMPRMPREPEAFAEQVATLLKRLQPSYQVELSGPRELLINGRRLDLENLYRMVNHEPDRGVEIVEHYLDQLFTGDGTQLGSMTLEFVRPRIMPRIQPESIFQHLSREMVAHVPFVNETVVVFVIDLPQMTVSITTEQMIRWGVGIDELEEIAKGNLDKYAPELEVQIVESKEGGRAAILAEQDGYDAARLLLTNLFDTLAPRLGGNFYVALPARDMFLALSADPEPFVKRLQDRVMHDYRRLPYPITNDFFLVTRDGVAGTKAA